MSSDILRNLNAAQYEAVTAPLAGQYQILAGPGTGKTKTLTTRIAYLMETVPAENIIVMTFTNLAAKEMKTRIKQMLPGDPNVGKLHIGTFHGECFKYLVRYGSKIGLSNKLSIADPSDQMGIIKEIFATAEVKELVGQSAGKVNNKIAQLYIKKISELKSHGYKNAEDFSKVIDQRFLQYNNLSTLQHIYRKYQTELEENDLVDFDDIILSCRDLLKQFPEIVSNIQAVLVDEFQDSNQVQLEITQLFAQSTGNITIVGDPDQSIYAFRNAQPENIRTLQSVFPNSKVIYLEENYRSIQPILNSAMSVIKQDNNRIGNDRMLKSQDASPTSSMGEMVPAVIKFESERAESRFVIKQIKYLVESSGGLINFSDVAILTRNLYSSKSCELELGFNKIPYKIIAGFKFWDREEVRVIIDYLRVINNDNDKPAVARTLNVPKRGIGAKSLEKILTKVDKDETIMGQLRKFSEGKTDLSAKIKEALKDYICIIDECREIVRAETDPVRCINDILTYLVERTKFNGDLERKEEEKRAENIELIRNHIGSVFDVDEDGKLVEPDPDSTPVQQFLLSLSLGVADDSQNASKVTISTIHSAKGLEWPIVFSINSVDDHVLRSGNEGKDEERRLLFVSLTRAKILLYITYPVTNSRGNGNNEAEAMRFLEVPANTKKKNMDFRYMKTPKGLDELTAKNFHDFARFLQRPIPNIEVKDDSKKRSVIQSGFITASEFKRMKEGGTVDAVPSGFPPRVGKPTKKVLGVRRGVVNNQLPFTKNK